MGAMTSNQAKLLRLLDYLLIEIRAVEPSEEGKAKLIANAAHKIPSYLLNWNEQDFENYVAELEKRFAMPGVEHLGAYLERCGLRIPRD